MQTRRSTQPNTFTIRYIDADPKRAQRVVQTLLDTFMEDSLGFKQTDTGTASRFLEARLQDYEQRLNDAESRLAEFKRDNVGVLPGDGGDYFSRMQEEGSKLEALRGRAMQLTQRRAELVRQLEGEEPTFGLVGGESAQSRWTRRSRHCSGRVDQLLARYTDKHPEVVALQEQITELEKDREAGKTGGSSAPRGVSSADEALARSLDMNPVYQNIRISLSSTEAELAELRGEIAGAGGGGRPASLASRRDPGGRGRTQATCPATMKCSATSTARCSSASSPRAFRRRRTRAPTRSSSA